MYALFKTKALSSSSSASALKVVKKGLLKSKIGLYVIIPLRLRPKPAEFDTSKVVDRDWVASIISPPFQFAFPLSAFAPEHKFNFRIFVDDAHGIGTMGNTGAGSGEELGCQDQIDVYFGTFAKSFASVGAFISSTEDVVEYLRYNMRSQIFAKSLPMPIVEGAIKRLEIMRRGTEQKDKLWVIANALQSGLKSAGFNLGNTQSVVTPVYLTGGVGEATNLTFDLRENYNIFCSIVTYPVVPKGVILLRLIPTAVHTLDEVEYTIKSFTEIKDKLANGKYISDEIANV